MIAALLLAIQAPASSYGDQLLGALHTYEACMSTNALRIGRDNREPGDTVVAAARSECRPQFERWANLMQPEGAALSGVLPTESQSAIAVRSRVEGEALAGLLEARAKRP